MPDHDTLIPPSIYSRIEKAVSNAKEKHPEFCRTGGLFEAVSILTEEVGETAREVNDGELGRALEELGDVVAVCVRMMEHIDIAGTRRV